MSLMMEPKYPLLVPLIALVTWTNVMWLWMYVTRLPAIRRARMRLDPDAPRGEQMNELPSRVRWKADNYNHLFEQPTIFYAILCALSLMGESGTLALACAWSYVGLRIIHSLVQALWNKIEVRWFVFVVSTIPLLLLVGLAWTRVIDASNQQNLAHMWKPESPESVVTGRRLLVGRWHGKIDLKEGGTREWVRENRPDGTYTTVFHFVLPSGETMKQEEQGLWGISHDVYFSILRKMKAGDEVELADPSDPYHYNAYRVLELGQEVFRYQGLETGTTYSVKKLPPNVSI
jgi:hypothetical protein